MNKLYAIISICFILIITACKSEECADIKCESCPDGPDKCEMCFKYFKYQINKIYMDCFDMCPTNTYEKRGSEGMIQCLDCHEACYKGCNGSNSIIGHNGCNSCMYANVEIEANHTVYKCLNYTQQRSENICAANNLIGLYPEKSLNPTKTEYECKRCDPLCASCNSSGTSVEKDKCLCANGAVEATIDGIRQCTKAGSHPYEPTNLPESGFLKIFNTWESNYTIYTILGICSFIFLVGILTFYHKDRLKCKSRNNMTHEMVPLNPLNPENVTIEENRFNLIPGNELTKEERPMSSGQFGVVYKGFWKHKPVAIKILKNQGSAEAWNALKYEISIMHNVRGKHQHLHSLIGICLASDEIELVSELRIGSLKDYLRAQINELTTRDLVRYCCQIADAMEYLESKEIIHGDLAVRNVLVKDKGHIEVSDFGLARYLRGRQEARYDGKGAIWWMSIECLESWIKNKAFDFTTKNDIWAFGVTCWEIFTFARYEIPYQNIYDYKELLKFLKLGKRLEHVETCPSECYQLMLNSWMEKNKRMNFGHFHRAFETILTSIPKISTKSQPSTSNATSSNIEDPIQILHSLAKIRPNFTFPYGSSGLYPMVEESLKEENCKYNNINENLILLLKYEIFLQYLLKSANQLSPFVDLETIDSLENQRKNIISLRQEIFLETVCIPEFIETKNGFQSCINWQEKIGNITAFISELEAVIWKISYLEIFRSKHVIFIKTMSELNKAQQEPILLVLFISWEEDFEIVFDQLELFSSLIKSKTRSFGFVDLTISQEFSCYTKSTTIKHYINGQCIDNDVLSSVIWRNMVYVAQDLLPITVRPKKAIHFISRCPKSTENQGCIGWEREWKCARCNVVIEVGFNEMLYCKCGEAPAEKFQFRCGDPNHGLEFSCFDEAVLKSLLNKLSPKEELNFLVLGENGEWNENFVKALQNYIRTTEEKISSYGNIKVCKFVTSTKEFNFVLFSGLENFKHQSRQEIVEILQQFPEINSICIVLEPMRLEISLQFLYFISLYIGLDQESCANMAIFSSVSIDMIQDFPKHNSIVASFQDYENPHSKHYILETEAIISLLKAESGFKEKYPRSASELHQFLNAVNLKSSYKTEAAINRLAQFHLVYKLIHITIRLNQSSFIDSREELEKIIEVIACLTPTNLRILPKYDLFADILYCYIKAEENYSTFLNVFFALVIEIMKFSLCITTKKGRQWLNP